MKESTVLAFYEGDNQAAASIIAAAMDSTSELRHLIWTTSWKAEKDEKVKRTLAMACLPVIEAIEEAKKFMERIG